MGDVGTGVVGYQVAAEINELPAGEGVDICRESVAIGR